MLLHRSGFNVSAKNRDSSNILLTFRKIFILKISVNFAILISRNFVGNVSVKWKLETATMLLQIFRFPGNLKIWERLEILKFENLNQFTEIGTARNLSCGASLSLFL